MKLPPVGYRDWKEAAEDADADGRLEVLDANDRPFVVQVPPEFLEIARAAAIRRAAVALNVACRRADATPGALPPFTLLRGGPGT